MGSGLSVNALLAQAKRASRDKNWTAAAENLEAVLSRFPKNKNARENWKLLKNTAVPDLLAAAQYSLSQQEWKEAASNLKLAIALGAQGEGLHLSLAKAQLELGNAPQAIDSIGPVLDADSQNVEALNLRGRALREMGQGARSLLDLQNAVRLSATDARTLNNLGLTYRAMGDFEAAAELFERALVAEPDNPTLHNNLSQMISYKSSTTHLDKLKKTLSKVGPQSLQSAPLHFALFKALDELNDVDEAFKHLQLGNMLAKMASGYEFESEGVPYGLSKLLFERPIDMSIEFDKSEISPMFVTGLPRSGTTLVERILSQAPSVRPCGELTIVPLAMGSLLADVAKRKSKTLSLDDILNLRNVMQRQFSHYSEGQNRPIDKMPTNYRWIGYLCLALPEAHVIHLNRNSISVAWSLYRHLFTGPGVGYSNDFKDIAKAMVMHRDLMDLWRERFPNRVIDVQYHQLVHSPELVTKSLANKTDLAWSPAWVEPDTGRSEIRTASAQQARQSIYTQSDEAWRKYERQLSPLMDMLTSTKLL